MRHAACVHEGDRQGPSPMPAARSAGAPPKQPQPLPRGGSVGEALRIRLIKCAHIDACHPLAWSAAPSVVGGMPPWHGSRHISYRMCHPHRRQLVRRTSFHERQAAKEPYRQAYGSQPLHFIIPQQACSGWILPELGAAEAVLWICPFVLAPVCRFNDACVDGDAEVGGLPGVVVLRRFGHGRYPSAATTPHEIPIWDAPWSSTPTPGAPQTQVSEGRLQTCLMSAQSRPQ